MSSKGVGPLNPTLLPPTLCCTTCCALTVLCTTRYSSFWRVMDNPPITYLILYLFLYFIYSVAWLFLGYGILQVVQKMLLFIRRWPNKNFTTPFTSNSKFILNLTQRVTGSLVYILKVWSSWLIVWMIDCLRPCVRILDTEWLLWFIISGISENCFLSLQGSSAEFLCIQNCIYDSEFLKWNITIIFGLTSYHILMRMFILLL